MNIETTAKTFAPVWWAALFLAWLIAALATAGAIFLGEVMGMAPCLLCWYQRIAMFPLVLILGVGLLDADARSARYALPLAGVGLGLALYHCLVFWGVVVESLVPCGQGPSCADSKLQVAGGVPIPLLSLMAFAAIAALSWFAKTKGTNVNTKKGLVFATAAAVVAAFAIGVAVLKQRSSQEVARALQTSSDALVRAHSPVFGNPDAKVTIVEFFDPACETCRAFYPIVKTIVNAGFGQVRLVVRYAPLHQGSDQAIKILEAARLQGKYWQALERTLADQPRWAAHHSPQPQLIWEALADIGLDVERAKADAASAAIDQLLRQDMADMKALKVTATPGFFVNGRPLHDFGEAQLKALVNQEIARAKAP